ncbi:MAG TPA: hypothetical protein VHY58_22535 [Streptosporangiaceae bacterium]|jgi:hypothetical protein|nr:hypothetical protein [Streptosporangiaceae bacterium]
MRVYLAATMPALAAALKAGEIGPAPLAGFAVTPALREWYASGDLEELEYAALTVAARASLRLLAADEAAPPRRVVLAAEVPDDRVSPGYDPDDPAAVQVAVAAPVARLASAHIDDPQAAADVRAAVAALPAADRGDEDAKFLVDGAEGNELLWYAVQELPYLFG